MVVVGEATAGTVRPWNAQVRQRPCRDRPLPHRRRRPDGGARGAVGGPAGLSVFGGGHDWAGGAVREAGLLIDLGAMRQVTVEGAEARVAGGATVSDVLDAVRPHGYAAAVGTVSSVGFAGLTLGGGYGTLIGLVGLGVDNVLSAEVARRPTARW